MKEVFLADATGTEELGERLGRSLGGGTVIAFRGPLGAGKTTMTKGLARGLGIEETVTSPTFTIVSEYEGRLRLHHVDAYRLSGPEDFYSIGGEELLADPGGVCLVEWSERIEPALPPGAAIIELIVPPGGGRLARVSGAALESLLA
ncbi:MAG TPA: tRNA (adenosine(37)-N6)-threonylcarbamoyltransferase complex ATPase subunit type 1 TsaE [Spirochaetales bacterium]|nr:tRNA (adenosine(37)-N6)-threonylcarbamoyltransferase complex ATPase subunit type 1 TsaE [Spirochaetales bacterium]HRY55128.1 tRNA (adenosine(37)-N6)-threonylcarbamoyltransferase complex ATPase subunit type 1 TsaE [Spirochaetia bacterium]